MKYSIILPYYKRPELRDALTSFALHYADRSDYEVIIVEDSKNAADIDDHAELLQIISDFVDTVDIKHYVDDVVSFNPSHKYNLGVTRSTGQFVVLSSPEIVHESDILAGFDHHLLEDRGNGYVVCACKAMDDGVFVEWYQHSTIRNVLFHFCSAMSRWNYAKLGGFDEKYCAGIGFEDEDFVERVKSLGINFLPKDDLVTIHIEHDKAYIDDNRDLVEVNRALFLSQHGT